MGLYDVSRAFGDDGVPAGDTVTVRRRQVQTRPGSGELVLGPWSDATEHTVDGVGLDRMLSNDLEPGGGGDSFIQRGTIFAPHGADIEAGDRLAFPNGVMVTVSGIPDRGTSMFTGWRPPMRVEVIVTHG